MSKHTPFKVILVLFMIPVSLYLIAEYIDEKKLSECPEIKNDIKNAQSADYEYQFIDCKGVVSVSYLDGKYYISDKYAGGVAVVNNRKLYKFIGDDLYVVYYSEGTMNFSCSGNKEGECNNKKYYEYFKVNGQEQEVIYNSYDEIPIYRKVNTVSGELTLYKTLNEIPESDRKIFKELEKVKQFPYLEIILERIIKTMPKLKVLIVWAIF
ncbi:MAG: hypothetical protein NTZ49_02495 [Candidatus Parcubacteria bacterium]|nr:hypothetical protein [Candidatus Parcubacteria bacterium]